VNFENPPWQHGGFFFLTKARRQSLAVQALQVEAIKNTKTIIKLLIKFNMSIKEDIYRHIY
jgi:hypothetical protein